MFSDSDDSSFYSEAEAFDDSAIQAEGIHATVYKVDGERSLRAVKSVSAFKNARLEPHDIRSEIHMLARLSHPNIIELVEASYVHKLFRFSMPFVPLTLANLLDSPQCSPHPNPHQAPNFTSSRLERFTVLSKSLLFQLVTALSFLHTQDPSPIAHRDVKPSNVLITPSGCVKLIDFGISWEGKPRGEAADLSRGAVDNGRLTGFSDAPKPEWEEQPEKMCCQVSSGPYRAPELLFAPKRYDAIAVDLWSLGALAAGFFTSLRFEPVQPRHESEFDWDALIQTRQAMPGQGDLSARHSSGDGDDVALGPGRGLTTGGQGPLPPNPTFPFDPPTALSRKGNWKRTTLFDATNGEIGLVASIFRLLGTPTEETWPDFTSLPAASALAFTSMPSQPLQPLLPNLPIYDNPESLGHVSPILRGQNTIQTNHQEGHASNVSKNSTSIADSLTTQQPNVATSAPPNCYQEGEQAVNLIQCLVRYPPESRVPASELLRHNFFTKGMPILHPWSTNSSIEYHDSQGEGHGIGTFVSGMRVRIVGESGEGYTLADIISSMIDPTVCGRQ